MFRNVLITGASSGLGRGLALHFAASGSTVHAAARRADELARLAAEAAPGQIVPVPLDVADAGALERAIRAAEAASGGALDLVVANAGVGSSTGAKLDWAGVKQTLDVNATSACATMALALPAMIARRSGTVVGMGSQSGFVATPGMTAYGASKAALQRFVAGLRVDLAGTGVRAIIVNPGYVKTPMTAGKRTWMPFLVEFDDAIRTIARGIERGRPVVSFPLGMRFLVRTLLTMPRWLREPVVRWTQKQ